MDNVLRNMKRQAIKLDQRFQERVASVRKHCSHTDTVWSKGILEGKMMNLTICKNCGITFKGLAKGEEVHPSKINKISQEFTRA